MRKMNSFPVLSISVTVMMLTLCSCNSLNKKQSCCNEKGTCKMNITKAQFGKTPAGEQVDVYTLTNTNGLECRIITYGGTCISLKTPDREGNLGDILLGHDNLEGYLSGDTHPYFGSLVGRYGNRIAKGKFTIDGNEYSLATNNNENHLHGGVVGFSHKVWRAEPVKADNGVALKLQTISMDGDEGYPGTLSAQVIYTLTNRNELKIDYEATTDKPTVCNLTNHNYYNFAGAKRDILDHILMINAETCTPVDAGLIPTGELAPVEDTPFDFSAPKAIGKDINVANQQITYGGGYDHNWVLNKEGNEMSLAAEVYDPSTGRVMTISTNEPAIQFYTGNFLDGTIKGKNGTVYERRFGFCLETQHSPDSPNRPQWPTTVLRPGETYKTSTIHKFSIR